MLMLDGPRRADENRPVAVVVSVSAPPSCLHEHRIKCGAFQHLVLKNSTPFNDRNQRSLQRFYAALSHPMLNYSTMGCGEILQSLGLVPYPRHYPCR